MLPRPCLTSSKSATSSNITRPTACLAARTRLQDLCQGGSSPNIESNTSVKTRWTACGKHSPFGPEVRAVCGKAACTDLCEGRPVMGVPTATDASSSRCSAHFSAVPTAPSNVNFSNRPFRVKRFQTIHHYSVDVAHGLWGGAPWIAGAHARGMAGRGASLKN
jgi:hypothetical protein